MISAKPNTYVWAWNWLYWLLPLLPSWGWFVIRFVDHREYDRILNFIVVKIDRCFSAEVEHSINSLQNDAQRLTDFIGTEECYRDAKPWKRHRTGCSLLPISWWLSCGVTWGAVPKQLCC